jgi:threonine dehydratase
MEAVMPGCGVHIVEPEAHDDFGRSVAAGEQLSNPPDARSICDALLTPCPGVLTMAIAGPRLKGCLAISDDEARRAVAFAFHELKLVVEPGGAAALAALLSGRFQPNGRPVAVVLSGGNIDVAMLDECLKQA